MRKIWGVLLRYIHLWLAALLLSGALYAATDAIIDAPYQPDYAKGIPERHLWKTLRENFIKHHYRRILSKYAFELTCNGCSTVYMDVTLSVNLTGQAEIRNVETAKACGKDFPAAMRKEFLDYLRTYSYPMGLFGTSVRLRLGTGLSC